MRSIKFIGKVTALLIITFLIVPFIEYKNYSEENNVKEVSVIKRKSEEIIYERIGSEKGIFSYEILSGKNNKLHNLEAKCFYANADTGLFYREDKDNIGIFTLSSSGATEENLILKDYIPIGIGETFGNEVVFLAEKVGKDKGKLLCKYNLTSKKVETREVNIDSSGIIEYVDFIDSNNFAYSKKINPKKESEYQSYFYDLAKNKEEQAINLPLSALNPVVSSSKSKTAFIKKDGNRYNLYVFNNSSKKSTRIQLKDGVVGGSIVWSPDDKYIICTTLNKGSKNMLNIIDLENNKIHLVDNMYSGVFSSDSKRIIGAAYEKNDSIQYIYSINLESKEKKSLYSFYEKGSFSKSIKIIEYNTI